MPFANYMKIALHEARAAASRGEVPVGACIVSPDGEVVAQAGNNQRTANDPTAHAEVLAIQKACKSVGTERLTGHSLYVTLEPCAMCAGAIANARIGSLYFGASDQKSGGVVHGAKVFSHPQAHHRPEIYDGISEAECSALLKDFFRKLR